MERFVVLVSCDVGLQVCHWHLRDIPTAQELWVRSASPPHRGPRKIPNKECSASFIVWRPNQSWGCVQRIVTWPWSELLVPPAVGSGV